MKKTTKLRLIGAAILLFNIWLISHFHLSDIPAILITFGFAIGYEKWIVRPALKSEANSDQPK